MNMVVGAALTGTAIPASAVEPNDPIFAAIEAHKAAHFRTTAAVDRQAVFERELVANGRLENRNRLEDERQQGAEIEAAIDEAWDDERDAACDLLSIHPSTMVGMIALLAYARDHDTDGMGWPDELLDGDWRAGYSADCLEDTRSWQYFLIANLVEILPAVVGGKGYA